MVYDSWDWESDFVWSGQVNEVMAKLKASPFVHFEEGVYEFNADKAANVLQLKEKLGMSEDHEIPPLTLMRADGTTLYMTRDVAYSVWKFKRAEKVINVIGMEQSLAQLQLKVGALRFRLRQRSRQFRAFRLQLRFAARLQDEQPPRTLHHF